MDEIPEATFPRLQYYPDVCYIVAHSAVVLGAQGGLFPLMALPARLFIGGRLDSGDQVVPCTLVVDGWYSQPKRLLELGYQFHFPTIEAALWDLFQ